MPKSCDERITQRREPAKRWHRQQPTCGLRQPIPLCPKDLRKGEVASERLSPGDEVNPGGGLSLGQLEHSHISQLPGNGLERHRRPRHNEVCGGRAEPAVSVEDEDVR